MAETAVIALVGLLVAVVAALAMRPRGGLGAALWGLGAGAAACALLATAASRREPLRPPAAHLPLQTAAPGDVTSRACRSCHPDQYASWHSSYHRTMTQVASPASVLGDFRDARVSFDGEEYRFYARDGDWFGEIRTAAPRGGDGEVRTVRLEQTTGSHHMQIYWMASGAERRLEAFPLVWLRSQQRWIPRTAAFVTPPSDDDARPSVWNDTCIGCHTTHPRPRLTLTRPPSADSHVTEFGIACEACHGSGAEHVTANHSPLHRYRAHFSSDAVAEIVNPSRLTHVRSAQVCGQCHSVRTFHSDAQARTWAVHGSQFRPGEDLDAAFNVISNQTLDRPYTRRIVAAYPDFVSGSFWDDGIVRVVGREYNALLESGCFQRGELACTSCHSLHQAPDDRRGRAEWANDQLAPGMDGDHACTQCHESFADAQVARDHTHHPTDSAGSACQNCHMPHTTYGLLKASRSHEIGSPRVITNGPGSSRPNACNLCHLDRPLAWSADHLASWYGHELPPLSDDDRRIAAGVRWALTGDAGVRALVAWSMSWPPAREAAGSDWQVPYLLELIEDPYDAVRLIAARSLDAHPEVELNGFDPVASAADRAAGARSLRERWARAHTESRVPHDATLLDAQGRVLAVELARLRAQRDDRPLNLAE